MLEGLLVVLVVAALLAGVFVLPLLAFLRTLQIGELRERLDRLEHDVARLRHGAPRPPAEPAHERLTTHVEEALPAEPVRPARRRVAVPTDAATLEAWLGRKGLGWMAVVLLLFATAFFLKYAFDNRWVGELGRVSLGIAAGAALCLAGLRLHLRGRRLFGQMLTAAGVALLYLATFGAFGYYHLLPQHAAAEAQQSGRKRKQ